MERIKVSIVPISESNQKLKKLLVKEFDLGENMSEKIIKNSYDRFMRHLSSNLWVVIESPYVDKMYRNSYYNYFSSQSRNSKKNCIRISLFSKKIAHKDFRSKRNNKLLNSYLGFIVIRPTPENIIGRNQLNPIAFKINNFSCCQTEIQSTVDGVKLSVKGFPHCSQDSETIRCAESALWSCMEYFGTKYPNYKPVLPSDIMDSSKAIAFERQLPSDGLDSNAISFVLKNFGFGNKVYSASVYKEFETLFSIYIESGLPIMNLLDKKNDNGHVTLGIGRKDYFSIASLRTAKKYIYKTTEILDINSIQKRYVFIDDNDPPYRIASFDTPCDYSISDSTEYKIGAFIVPLYSKIYLEASQAREFIYTYLKDEVCGLPQGTKCTLRVFLTSSRSYKDWVAKEERISYDLREIIVRTPMPKFIWVGEIGTIDSFLKKEATGLIILDSTAANVKYMNPFVLSAHSSMLISFTEQTKDIHPRTLNLDQFPIYENNLVTTKN